VKILLIIFLTLPGCTVYQPLPQPPPQKVFNFAIRPLDPPVQDENEKGCVPIGFDGLACQDQGLEI
jgi:hypothetical protein